jgi:hypothetical protein
MTYLFKLLFTAALFFLLSASIALGAQVSIQPLGNGVFVIQGNGMDGVAGIQLDISYDKASLKTPSVTQGGLVTGAIFAANTGSIGRIYIGIIRTSPITGSGQIATITFSGGSGSLQIVSQKLIDSAGAPTGADTANGFLPAGIPFSQTTLTSLGTVTMPTDVQTQPKVAEAVKPPEPAMVPAKNTEPAVAKPVEPPAEKKAGTEPQKPEKVTTTSYRGILDNFSEYKGEKSPAILIALFNKIITPSIRQEPTVVLSDGKTPLKIVVEIPVASAKSPNFALNGAKLVSLAKDVSSAWIIETLPNAGVMRASLTILTDSDIIEYPLTLAPPVGSFSPTEVEFALFLKDSGAATPKRDLNGDGKHDYLDDFIYTANFLVRKGDAVKGKN